LAEGGFSHVYLVFIQPNQDIAVLKRVAAPDLSGVDVLKMEIENHVGYFSLITKSSSFFNVQKKLSGHNNIVTYMDSIILPMKNGGYEVFILMEYCGGGQLIGFMNERLETRLSEDQVLDIFADVCEAITLMHSQNPILIHR
jgi:AP2-associated kinase